MYKYIELSQLPLNDLIIPASLENLFSTADMREAQINLLPLFTEPRNRRRGAKQLLYLISLLQGPFSCSHNVMFSFSQSILVQHTMEKDNHSPSLPQQILNEMVHSRPPRTGPARCVSLDITCTA